MTPAWHPPWPGAAARGSLVLPLSPSAFGVLAPCIRFASVPLQRKQELHVTLLDRALLARVLRVARPSAIASLFDKLDWRWQGSGERWLLRRRRPGQPLAHSVIELIDMPALNQFRGALAQASRMPIGDAVAHVTLYTAGDPRGIGLASHAQFQQRRITRCD